MKRVVWVLWIVLAIGTTVQGIASDMPWFPLPEIARASVAPFLPGPSDEVLVTVSGTYYGGPPDAVVGWADAKIEGPLVIVSSDEVKAPVAVRYAWAANPDVNLCNKAGLLASPFRTDHWEEEITGR